jgi:hypothetical protein
MERNAQVLEMRNIYANAEEVAIWLGVEADNSSVAIKFILKLIEFLEYQDVNAMKDGIMALLADKVFSSLVLGVAQLFRRPWWSRVWIIQEVTISMRATIYCGPETLDWLLIQRLSKVVYRTYLKDVLSYRERILDFERATQMLFLLLNTLIGPAFLVDLQTQYLNGNRMDLLTLAVSAGSFLASDSRDRVFALLGLMNPPSQLRADYWVSVRQVYMSATIQILQEYQNLGSFGFFYGYSEEPPESDFTIIVTRFQSIAR